MLKGTTQAGSTYHGVCLQSGEMENGRIVQMTTGGEQRHGGDRMEHRAQWLNVDGTRGRPWGR